MSSQHEDSDDEQHDRKRQSPPPPPSFGGPDMATIGICFDNVDEDAGEETTRRVGGGFNPSFAPSNVSFEAPIMQPLTHGGTFSTAAPKATALASVSSAPAAFRWNLPEAPTLPQLYPLERSAVFCPNTTTVSAVSTRISNVLRDRSIEASFDNEKARAKCVTEDGVDFRVRLYRGRGTYAHGIIVEVQRRCGTSLNFHQDCQAILDAAQGKTPAAPKKISSQPSFDDDGYKPQADASLNRVARLMDGGATALALETLTSLTDPSKVGKATAASVSQALLAHQVGGKLLMWILNNNNGVSESDEEPEVDERTMALVILSQVLEQTTSLPDAVQRQLHPVLKNDLHMAQEHPRVAAIAARCVLPLIQKNNSESLFDIYDEVLEAAAAIGTDRHAGLMRQAEACLSALR